MRWTKLLASCMTLIAGVLLGSSARALSLNADDISNDTVLISGNGKLQFSNIQFFLEPHDDEDFTLTVLEDGLLLTGPMFVSDGDDAEFYYSYQVTALDPTQLINGVSLFAPTSIVDGGSPTFAKTSKEIFAGGPGRRRIGMPPPIAVLETANFAGGYTEFAETSLDPRATLTILDGIHLTTKGPGDSAEAEGITNRFSVVPEPTALVLIGSGLLGLTLAGRRSRR